MFGHCRVPESFSSHGCLLYRALGLLGLWGFWIFGLWVLGVSTEERLTASVELLGQRLANLGLLLGLRISSEADSSRPATSTIWEGLGFRNAVLDIGAATCSVRMHDGFVEVLETHLCLRGFEASQHDQSIMFCCRGYVPSRDISMTSRLTIATIAFTFVKEDSAALVEVRGYDCQTLYSKS